MAALIPGLKDNGRVKDAECPVGRPKGREGEVEKGSEEILGAMGRVKSLANSPPATSEAL